MKPFNLEAALRGEPVITRDGRPVEQIFHVTKAKNIQRPLVVVIEGRIRSYSLDGTRTLRSPYANQKPQSTSDLFMTAVVKDYYLNIYRTTALLTKGYDAGKLYGTIDEALEVPGAKGIRYVTTIKVQIEE